MRYILCIFSIFVCLASCSCSRETQPNEKIGKGYPKPTTVDRKMAKRFNGLGDDASGGQGGLRDRGILTQRFTEVKCEGKPLPESDSPGEARNIFVREYLIAIADTVEIRVLQRRAESLEYVYTYRSVPFKVKNLYGGMFRPESEISFAFDRRRCYRMSGNRYLMREQPLAWCGLANQFDFFQVVDLNRMEMIQFADRDEKIE